MDEPLFEMTPRPRLKVGEAVVVSTIVGDRRATIASPPHGDTVAVLLDNAPRVRRKGRTRPPRPVVVLVSRVRRP